MSHARHRLSRAPLALAGLVAVGLLAGCSLVPPYERPAAPIASHWPDTAGAPGADTTTAADLPWQQFVRDDQLRELIGLALTSNRDLRVAVQNIEQARAQFQIRRADQFPSVGASASGTRSAPNPYQALGGPSVPSNYTVGIGVGVRMTKVGVTVTALVGDWTIGAKVGVGTASSPADRRHASTAANSATIGIASRKVFGRV